MARFAGYQLEECLGRGGMGEVWRARRGDEPAVALKLLADSDAGTVGKRLLNEGQILTRLNHPNVVRVHEFGVAEGRPYMALELLAGKSLSDLLKELRHRGETLPAGEVLRIATAVAEGLAAAHQAGILHRDVKPSNVMLAGERVVVLDFGIARSEGDGAQLTQPGAQLGSLVYMSPEQINAGTVDARSDVYQFGLLVFELVTLARPHSDLRPADAVTQRLSKGVPALPATAGAELATLVADCLRIDVTQRPPSFQPVLERLGRVPGGAPTRVDAAAPPADAPPPTPETIGPYRIAGELGHGGMGIVYRARKDGGPEVALKIMFPRFATDPDVAARFRREIRLARAVEHPNVVRVLDDGCDGQTLWFAMEFVQGKTLLDIVREEGKVSVDEGLAFISDVVEAIDAMHEKGCLHRDLKPANVMLEKTGRVRVMDLGMSKSEDVTALTRTGEMVGTPAYYPPEYADFQSYDERGDLYQIGLILHEIVTGRRNFPRSDGEKLSSPMTGGRPLPVPPEIDKAGAAVAGFYRRLVSPSPGQRFQSTGEVKRALADLPAGMVSRSVRMAPAPAAKPAARPVARPASKPVPKPLGRPASRPVAVPAASGGGGVAGALRWVGRAVNVLMLLAILGVGLVVLVNLPAIFHRFTAH